MLTLVVRTLYAKRYYKFGVFKYARFDHASNFVTGLPHLCSLLKNLVLMVRCVVTCLCMCSLANQVYVQAYCGMCAIACQTSVAYHIEQFGGLILSTKPDATAQPYMYSAVHQPLGVQR